MSRFSRGLGPARALRARVPMPKAQPAIHGAVRAPSPGEVSVAPRPQVGVAVGVSVLAGMTVGAAVSVALRDPPVRGGTASVCRQGGSEVGHPRALVAAGATGGTAGGATGGTPGGAETGPSLRDRLRAVLAPPLVALLPRPGSILEWPGSLRPFQLDGVGVLLTQPEVLLADDMGLGKTVQAIAALRILIHRSEVESALVVAPASLIHQWRQELGRWAPELRVSTVTGTPEQRPSRWSVPAHVFLVTYETLRSDLGPHPSSGPRRRTWGVVVLDEAQKIKNRATGVSTSCKMLPRRRSWALTGTPLENKVDDLVSILEFLEPNPHGAAVAPLHYDAALADRHRRLQLRRRKADVLAELPPKTVNRVLLDLPDEQMRSYRRAEEDGVVELRRRGETIRLTHVLQLITRLKQICNFCPETGVSAKLIDLLSRLEVLSEEGHKVLVFCQYTDDVFGVRAIERGAGRYNPLTFTGDLSQEERRERITRFKKDNRHRALILSLRAGGQGLNLQEASYVVHFDRWWNPATERQAEDRSHRMGQTMPVTVYTYTCAGTIEERIADLLEEKQKLFDFLIDDVSLELDRVLTVEDLFGLFGLVPPPSTVDAATRGSRDFAELTGREFEEHVAQVFRRLGFSVQLTQASRDRGVDVIARRTDVVGIETTLFVQCKNHAAPVGVETVRALIGAVPAGDPGARAVLVCPAGFSADATALAVERGVQLVDEKALRSLADRGAGESRDVGP